MKKLRKLWRRDLWRPFIYTVFSRLLTALAVVLLADYFLSGPLGRSIRGVSFLLAAILFALLGWIAYLRLDGVEMPKPLSLRVGPRRKPVRMYGDMIDDIDEEPRQSFADLDDGEKDLCLLLADLLCCLVFAAASML